MHTIVVREYARLTTAVVSEPSLDLQHVSDSAFDWLCAESARLRASGAQLVQLDGRRSLRLDNYVGVIETPCGTRVEILPKSADNANDAESSRRLLRRMLERCLDIPTRDTAPSEIQAFDAPLTEWVTRQFLHELDRVIKRGLRFDYHMVKEEQRFVRGRLDVMRQLRQRPGHADRFQMEHDVFDADRAENRLLRSALDRVCRLTRDAGNWRLSHELASYLAPVPSSTDFTADFRRWRTDRLLAHYRGVRPWCALILGETLPMSIAGSWHGCSLLLPMEKLFERYVAACLRRTLPAGITLAQQRRSRHLATHRRESWFTLIPDLLLDTGERTIVLDTKWKRIDKTLANGRDKYRLSESDFYQMYAYGQCYLGGDGDVALVFPKTSTFDAPLEVFTLGEGLRLWVIPFDLESGSLCLQDNIVELDHIQWS